MKLRLLLILPSISPTRPRLTPDGHPSHILVVLGSGGHTAEMMSLLRDLDPTRYTYRTYVVSSGDAFSALKAEELERSLLSKHQALGEKGDSNGASPEPPCGTHVIIHVPRAREIHQPLYTTAFTALYSVYSVVSVLLSSQTLPDVIITNGPGTGVCVVFAALLLKYFGVRGARRKMRTIYVESWARVKTLSLSGKILLRCVDRFLVQWEGLSRVGGRAEYRGVLVH